MKRVIDALTPEEAMAVKASFKGKFAVRNRALVELMLNTGLRIKEAVSLNVEDIFDGLTVKPELYVRPETAKRKKARYIPLNENARAALWDVLAFNEENGYPLGPCDPVFVSQRQGPTGEFRLCTQAFQHIIRRKRKAMGVKLTVTPHIFRHTFISRVYRLTKSIRIAQDLAGHADISTTMRYTHTTRSEMADAVNMLAEKPEARTTQIRLFDIPA